MASTILEPKVVKLLPTCRKAFLTLRVFCLSEPDQKICAIEMIEGVKLLSLCPGVKIFGINNSSAKG